MHIFMSSIPEKKSTRGNGQNALVCVCVFLRKSGHTPSIHATALPTLRVWQAEKLQNHLTSIVGRLTTQAAVKASQFFRPSYCFHFFSPYQDLGLDMAAVELADGCDSLEIGCSLSVLTAAG